MCFFFKIWLIFHNCFVNSSFRFVLTSAQKLFNLNVLYICNIYFFLFAVISNSELTILVILQLILDFIMQQIISLKSDKIYLIFLFIYSKKNANIYLKSFF